MSLSPLSATHCQNTLSELKSGYYLAFFLGDPDEDVQPRLTSSKMTIIQGEVLGENTGERGDSSRPWKERVAVHRALRVNLSVVEDGS